MKKTAKRGNKTILVGIVLFIIIAMCMVLVWLYDAEKTSQSEACKKWEELKSKVESETQSRGNVELQQGVSMLQAEAIRYRDMCREGE